jgi:hypothetical protein
MEVKFMVLNASSKIAVKCSECGKYNIVDINIFKLRIPTSVRCDCGHRMFKACVINNDLVLDIDCIACEKQHNYKYKLKSVLEKPISIISCPATGMEIAFLGKDCYVDDVIKRYMDDMFELLKHLGIIEEKVKRVVK